MNPFSEDEDHDKVSVSETSVPPVDFTELFEESTRFVIQIWENNL